MKERLIQIINNFKRKRILVIGDIMLDKYIYGDVSRISPEAPVQIVRARKESYKLGGSGNVVNNITSLGAKATIIGEVGKDKEKDILIRLLREKKIKSRLISTKKPTITKIRVVGRSQQLIRIDYEDDKNNNVKEIIKKVKRETRSCDAIIISDYAKGSISTALMKKVLVIAKGKSIIVDPKPSHNVDYSGATLITPNEKESYIMSGLDKGEKIFEVIKKLEQKMKTKILVTRGKDGMAFIKKNELIEVPTIAEEVYDVTGAGDTVIAVLALSIASGANLEEATVIANHCAGIVVTKFGTATVSARELLSAIEKENRKLKSQEEIIEIRKELKKQGKKVVFTNGCFDILHTGHVRLLEKTRALGDVVILGLNSDSSVRKIKGPTRPIIKESERAEILSALECIDYIVFFDERTPVNIIKKLKPDIHVKGGDYTNKPMPERKVIEGYGGKVVLIPLFKDFSTTSVIEKIKNEKA
ncbi:MAG: D-glycero-beta-D-manno-heptose-7-phosphate kinase [Nanoarchaeota archaeon]|nr:D-glycero-beta-D-manno-heptose-7-phosphate kinase [DPANN group archaeon]MBL7116656.1 D-glycero-beta-D-manno-heptose-7-phosphate kinase [Nanoarchaeota archaeon]